MAYSTKRQRFLVNQGYAFKIVTKLPGLETDPDLSYGSREDQQILLQKVLAANEMACEEEALPSEFQSSLANKNGPSRFSRKSGSMGAMSGGDSRHYVETAASKKKKKEAQHPLFRAFR